ncbi:MAG: hypothetical protein H0W02_22510 [Ktedonobacteraceae bacterium]|nr:hypothetical protein [Ktedonobacteraceae bacterium]
MKSIVRSKRFLTLCAMVAIIALAVPVATFVVSSRNTAKAASLTFAPQGNLDCNGFSKIQKPLRAHDYCTDFKSPNGERGEDNGHYVGHDEPSIQFFSSQPHSGNNVKWSITLPKERPLPASQTFENQIAFWFSMALCDPGSFPQGACIPNSDKNNPQMAGSAFLEMQFYPPGFSPFISQISCDLKHWCASLHINSLECTAGFAFCNPNCLEPTNFAFIQMDGIPTGPAGPINATNATFTPNAHTLLMNQGDKLEITIKDTSAGLINQIRDKTTGKSGFMVASAKNGFQSLDPATCAPTNFSFHPEFNTAKFGNFVPWAALQANVGFASEIGHFTPGINGDGDADDAPCFAGPTLPGCLNFAQGGDVDFDGTSYLPDWPDGTPKTPTSLQITSVLGNGIGPVSSSSSHDQDYKHPYPAMIFETDVLASESTCTSTGAGCTVPPPGAAFYPFFAQSGHGKSCALTFGNDIRGKTINDFGRDLQYGVPNLPWFFGTASSGIQPNPCLPRA